MHPLWIAAILIPILLLSCGPSETSDVDGASTFGGMIKTTPTPTPSPTYTPERAQMPEGMGFGRVSPSNPLESYLEMCRAFQERAFDFDNSTYGELSKYLVWVLGELHSQKPPAEVMSYHVPVTTLTQAIKDMADEQPPDMPIGDEYWEFAASMERMGDAIIKAQEEMSRETHDLLSEAGCY